MENNDAMGIELKKKKTCLTYLKECFTSSSPEAQAAKQNDKIHINGTVDCGFTDAFAIYGPANVMQNYTYSRQPQLHSSIVKKQDNSRLDVSGTELGIDNVGFTHQKRSDKKDGEKSLHSTNQNQHNFNHKSMKVAKDLLRKKQSRLNALDYNNPSFSGDIDSRRSLNQSESNSVISSIQRNLYDSYGDSISPVRDNFRHKEAVATGWVGANLSPFKNEYLQQNGLKSKAQKINTRNQKLQNNQGNQSSHIGASNVNFYIRDEVGIKELEGGKSSMPLNSSIFSSRDSNKAQWICKNHGKSKSSNPNEIFGSNKAQHSKCTKELKQGSLYPKIKIDHLPEVRQKNTESDVNNVESNNFLSVPKANLNGQSNRIGSSSPRGGLVKKR